MDVKLGSSSKTAQGSKGCSAESRVFPYKATSAHLPFPHQAVQVPQQHRAPAAQRNPISRAHAKGDIQGHFAELQVPASDARASQPPKRTRQTLKTSLESASIAVSANKVVALCLQQKQAEIVAVFSVVLVFGPSEPYAAQTALLPSVTRWSLKNRIGTQKKKLFRIVWDSINEYWKNK